MVDGVLLEEGYCGAVAFELEALEETGDGASDLFGLGGKEEAVVRLRFMLRVGGEEWEIVKS